MTSLRRRTLQVLTAAVLVTSLGVGFRPEVVEFHQDRGTHHKQHMHFKPHDSSAGYVGNCEGGYYNISWTPKDVSPANRIEVRAGVVSPIELDRVHIVGSVIYEGTEMLAIDRDFSCQDLADSVAYLFPHEMLLRCPIKQGELLTGSFLFTDTEILIGYDGEFQLKATVYSLTGLELFCVEVKVTVLPFADS